MLTVKQTNKNPRNYIDKPIIEIKNCLLSYHPVINIINILVYIFPDFSIHTHK